MKEKLRFTELVYTDFRAMGENKVSIIRIFLFLLLQPRFLAVFLFRCSSHFDKDNLINKLFRRFFWRINCFLTACDIHVETKIGEYFNLPHPVGVVIARSTIGKNVTICQNVTIGVADFENPSKGNPIIGDNVTIFAGAVIVGDVTIGNNAKIGANSVVNICVPENATAVGVPARIIRS